MISLILYLVAAGIVSYIFKIIAGFLAGVPVMVWSAITGKELHNLFEERPRSFLFLGVFNHATIGVLYAFLIHAFSSYFVYALSGNYWLYFVLSVLWAFVAFGEISGMVDVFFFACVCGVPVLWFAGPYFLLALWILLLIVFVPIHFKRNGLIIAADDIPPDPGPIFSSDIQVISIDPQEKECDNDRGN